MDIVAPLSATDPDWRLLRLKLWPHASEAEVLGEMADTLARGHFVRLALASDGHAVGLVEAARRVDYVNGTTSSPVAFLEGLYVDPAWRRQGVGRALVTLVVSWAAAHGYTELASDSSIENVAAHAVHLALGFEETERVVYFRRAIPGDCIEAAPIVGRQGRSN